MKKRLLALTLALLLVCGGFAGAVAETIQDLDFADEAQTPKRVFDEIVVGTATRPSGYFFTNLWGNNTTDMDVRALLHGYSPVYLHEQITYATNPTVVESLRIGDYPDGNAVYIIKLKPELRYNDGSSITAADYVFSLLLQTHPALAALGADSSAFGFLAGYGEYHAGETDVLSGVRLLDELTFSMEISADYLPYFYELGLLDVYPYPIAEIAPGFEVIDTGAGVQLRSLSGTEALSQALLQETILNPESGYMTHPKVTSGPYTLTAYDEAEGTASFVVNDYFLGTHDGALPTIQRLALRPVNPDNAAALLASGEVHLLNKLANGRNVAEAMAVMNDAGAALSNYPRMGLGFISFNGQSGPFASEALRKALAYAVDVEALSAAFSPYAIPVYGYMGLGQWMYQYVNQEDAPVFAETDEDIAAWTALSLDGLNRYDFDLEKSRRLLIEDGWTLNASGDAYVDGQDTVRYKLVDGQLEPLQVRWGRTQGSVAADELEAVLPQALAEIGMQLEITETSFGDVLADYYAPTDREFDMVLLATNFGSVFDPSLAFGGDPAGLADPVLEEKALAMRSTDPGDYLAYAQRWLDFQEAWNERLPLLPLYSNVYFDFYVQELENYLPNWTGGWAEAIVSAYTTEEAPIWLQVRQAEATEEAEAEAGDEQELEIFD